MNQVTPHQSEYRAEIDGLRAVAVSSVVAFHAFPSWFKGGFIGVDIFFVISGFLITSHIFEQLDKGKFGFADFFGRRIRRIFPALILVMASSLALGWFVLLPAEYTQLGKHVASGAAFITNFILVDESGYFDNAADTKPMLHLWSLAVEEQFYIIWPLVLWFAWKRRFNLLIVTLIVAVVSFYLNLRFVLSNPIETFFWPVGRFWELLSGSLLAWLLLYKNKFLQKAKIWIEGRLDKITNSKSALFGDTILENAMSFVGLLVLAYGVFRINEELPFPSTWALFPVLGAVLVISAGSKAWFNRVFLMNPIAVWFGLISYPLYLWHWPILSFLHILDGVFLDRGARVVAVLVSVLLAWLTYNFVEQPIRFGANKKRWAKILILIITIVGLVGFFIESKKGFAVKDGHKPFYFSLDEKYYSCENRPILESSNKNGKYRRCWQSKQGEPTVMLIGDSHAEHLFFGLAEELQNENVAFYIEAGRPSLIDKEFKIIFAELAKVDGRGKTVLITTYYLQDFQKYDLVNELRNVVRLLKGLGYSVAILGDVPRFNAYPKACQNTRVFLRHFGCELLVSELDKQVAVYEPHLIQLAKDERILYLSTNNKIVCNEYSCSMIDNSVPLYRDPNHLSETGSMLFGGDFAKRLRSQNIVK